jgi:hypothetical protein
MLTTDKSLSFAQGVNLDQRAYLCRLSLQRLHAGNAIANVLVGMTGEDASRYGCFRHLFAQL